MEKEDIKEHADRTYEQVSGWINNCDSKASILLALIGVFLTIVFTSDFISQGIIEQLKDVIGIFKHSNSRGVLFNVLLIALIGCSVYYFIISIKKLLLVLFARLDDSRDKENPSISFYRSIGAKDYDAFKQLVESYSNEQLVEDKLRQVYDCSKICSNKFSYYNEGIQAMKSAFIFLGIYFLSFLLLSSL